jgi:hypothetical protein
MSNVVIQSLVRDVLRDGAVPIVVYFPYMPELALSAKSDNASIPLPTRMLREAGINYHDMTACLIEAGISEGYMAGGHYSPKAHAHIALCLEPVLREEISRLKQ